MHCTDLFKGLMLFPSTIGRMWGSSTYNGPTFTQWGHGSWKLQRWGTLGSNAHAYLWTPRGVPFDGYQGLHFTGDRVILSTVDRLRQVAYHIEQNRSTGSFRFGHSMVPRVWLTTPDSEVHMFDEPFEDDTIGLTISKMPEQVLRALSHTAA